MAKIEKHQEGHIPSKCLAIEFPYEVTIRFPGDLEYIPAIRKFFAELLQVSNFNPRFAYRSEIIVDEICNNAVAYGCHSEDAEIELCNRISNDNIEFTIKDQGGSKENVTRLKRAIKTETTDKKGSMSQGLGLEIVRMLSERLDVVIDEDNLTSVHIVRKREDHRKGK
jgi:anti-sigma regulatory factor (Ser/Thr protein kinase)